MNYCEHLRRAIDAAPEGMIKRLLEVLYEQAGCGGTVTPQSGGGTGGNPPTPPNPKP